MQTVVSVFGTKGARIGSVESYARELSAQLRERGWRSVLCFAAEPDPAVRRYLASDNVALEVLERSWEPGIAQARGMLGILRRHRPAILDLHFTGFLSPYPWLARWSGVRRVFFHSHGSPPAGFVARRAPLWKRLATRAINFPLTGVATVSDYGYRSFTAGGSFPPARIRRIYNGIELDHTPDAARAAGFRQRYGIPADRTVVLQVSWIIPEKGIADLLSAARSLICANPSVHFVVVGEGSHRPAFTKMGEELGLSGHLTWTGRVEDLLREGIYDAADVVCQCSRWQEAFGAVIAEAMAFRRPVVATRVGGIPELVEDGVTGWLAAPGDPEALAGCLERLLRDLEMRARMGEAGRRAAEAKFDLRRNVAELIGWYGLDALGR
jgi:glycosyltransferase involved in cell wall biosynthesis